VLRWVRWAMRGLYLSMASLLMLIGIVGLTDVHEVTGTLLGGSADLLSRYAVGIALLLLAGALLLRMRGTHWLAGLLLLSGAVLSAHSLVSYPPQADDPSISTVFSPGRDQLADRAMAFAGMFLILTVSSPRTRRLLRAWIGLRGRSAMGHKGFIGAYLALAASCLLAGWIATVHLARLIPLSDLPIASIERGAFNLTALGLVLFGLGMVCQCRAARGIFVAALLAGIALTAFSLFALPLSVPGAPIAFAPTPDDLHTFLLRGTALLAFVVLSAPACRQVWRLWWRRSRRMLPTKPT
jgi:hypothetical protein